MPYEVHSRCSQCDHSDGFVIGNPTLHRGVLLCPHCKAIANLTVDNPTCTKCGNPGKDDALYDYSASIPYFSGWYFPPQPGPACLRCGAEDVKFRPDSHFSLTFAHGEYEGYGGQGQQYLEKDIFIFNLFLVCWEFKLPLFETMEWYGLQGDELRFPDKPRPSTPILLDIRTKLQAPFSVPNRTPEMDTPRSHEELGRTYGWLLFEWERRWRREGLPERDGHLPQMYS